MQIALCDDEERQLDLLGGFLRAYEAEHGMDLTLTRFFSGEALLGRRPESFHRLYGHLSGRASGDRDHPAGWAGRPR